MGIWDRLVGRTTLDSEVDQVRKCPVTPNYEPVCDAVYDPDGTDEPVRGFSKKDIEAMRWEIRQELKEELKAELAAELRQEAMTQIKRELKYDLGSELWNELLEGLSEDLRNSIPEILREDDMELILRMVIPELIERVKLDVKYGLINEIKALLNREVKKAVRAEVQSDTVAVLLRRMKKEFTNTKKEFGNRVREEFRRVTLDEFGAVIWDNLEKGLDHGLKEELAWMAIKEIERSTGISLDVFKDDERETPKPKTPIRLDTFGQVVRPPLSDWPGESPY